MLHLSLPPDFPTPLPALKCLVVEGSLVTSTGVMFPMPDRTSTQGLAVNLWEREFTVAEVECRSDVL